MTTESALKDSLPFLWEVLSGVGVDGGRRNSPVFFFFFSFFFSSLFFGSSFVFLRFFSFSLDKGQQLQFTGKMGNFTLTPSTPSPFKLHDSCLSSISVVVPSCRGLGPEADFGKFPFLFVENSGM